MERRENDNERSPRQSTNPNVFDDEYAVDPSDLDFELGVVDGFRPAFDQSSNQRDDQGSNHTTSRRSFSTTPTSDANLRRMASRNSTAKGPARNSFSILHDGPNAPVPGRNASIHAQATNSHAASLLHRTSISSTASFATMARSESTFPAGPSHPYGMYPQNTTVNRSSSVTTSSTIRQPHRSYSGPRPTHPYSMYSQNVIENPDENDITPAPPAIPVGFPGLNTGYHRQIGPDGEEQDIIGPDGHTEQLPPYSKYPEEGPTKASLVAEATSTPIETAAPGVNNSQDTLAALGNHPNRRGASEVQMLPMSEMSNGEKPQKARSWKELRRKRVIWGKVPVCVALLLGLLLLFAVILGAALGWVARKNMKHHKGDAGPTVTIITTASMFDASLIPTPSNLAPLPTGTFVLQVNTPQESSQKCLTATNQLGAWSCDMSGPLIQLSIGLSPGGGGNVASLNPLYDDDSGIQYGVQPPSINMQSLSLVVDQDYPTFGPAFHFQGMYNKLVVLENFAAGAKLRKKHANNKPPTNPDYRHRFEVQPGDSPWFCYWNQTFIEGYIYVQYNSSADYNTPPPPPPPSPTSCSPTTSSSSAPTSNPESKPPPSSQETSGSLAPASNLESKPPPSSQEESVTPAPPTTTPPPIQSYSQNKPIDWLSHTTFPYLRPRDPPSPGYPPPPGYPRVVKIEERRLPNSQKPYCQKMTISPTGSIAPANHNGSPIITYLQETDPTMQEFISASAGGAAASSGSAATTVVTESKRGLLRRDDPPNACHCQWIIR